MLKGFPGLPASRSMPAPPEWPQLVAGHEPAVAIAFALGNYPQLVRNLHPLLAGGDLAACRPAPRHSLAGPALLNWAKGQTEPLTLLLAAGVLRLAREYVLAAEVLAKGANLDGSWQALSANEKAALAWHRGEAAAALTLWQSQEPTVPVLFNRGMAALFSANRHRAATGCTRPSQLSPTRIPGITSASSTSPWPRLGPELGKG